MLDFTFEFLNEVEALDAEQEERLRQEALDRLRQLGAHHNDLIGAAMSLEALTKGQATRHLYQGRVVVYARPENVTAVAKEANPMLAVKAALDAVERQVREQREKAQDRHHGTSTSGTRVDIYDLSAREIFDTYADDRPPSEWLDQPREQIAAQLMADGNLGRQDAYYAADQILAFAQKTSPGRP